MFRDSRVLGLRVWSYVSRSRGRYLGLCYKMMIIRNSQTSILTDLGHYNTGPVVEELLGLRR